MIPEPKHSLLVNEWTKDKFHKFFKWILFNHNLNNFESDIIDFILKNIDDINISHLNHLHKLFLRHTHEINFSVEEHFNVCC